MESIIRVAHVMGKWVGGGVESVVMNYYRNIDRNKVQFDFICDNDSTNIPYEEIKQLGGRVILITPYQKIFTYQKELIKILKENNYKIVHSHINTISIFPLRAAKKANIPIRIAHSHSTTNKREWKKNLLKQVLKPLSRVFATDYFCCSELAGRWLFGNKEYNRGNVFLLNNAIDLEMFKYNELIRKNIRKELNIKDSTLVIGHIGRFVTQKNHDFLIDIFSKVHNQVQDSILLLVGQGPLEENIKAKVKELNLDNCIKFLGQRNDANKLYQAFDIFLLPSLYEGLPVVGVESQASGLLCILSESMTKETKIISTTQFISLEKTSQEWTNIILEKYRKFNRQDTTTEISKNNFNIKKEAYKLTDKYLSLLNKRERKIKMPKISVIMGVYNTPKEYLELAINSILNQTYQDFEFIICNDGSTDESFNYIKEHYKNNSKIIFMENDKNRGLAYTLNHCLKYAKGKYIARMDGDDYCDPNRLEKQITFLENNKDYQLVSTNIQCFDETGIWGYRNYNEIITKKDFLFTSPITHPTILATKESFDLVNGYRISWETNRTEDYDLFMRMYSKGINMYTLQEPLYFYREDNDCYKKRKYRYRFTEVMVRIRGFKQLKLYPLCIPYVLKPLIVGIIPQNTLKKLRLKREQHQQQRLTKQES